MSGPDPGRPAPGDLFTPVTMARASQAIVDQLRELILGGTLAVGERLPSERDLCDRFGVSRVTVREALRILEVGGLLTVKVGARGGAYITTPTRDRTARAIEDYLTLSPTITPPEITEARQLLEVGLIPMACTRATDNDIKELFALCDKAEAAIEAGTYTMEMSADFHMAVARSAHNEAVELLLTPFHASATDVGPPAIKEHRRLAQALRDKEITKATDLMRSHLERTTPRPQPRRRTTTA